MREQARFALKATDERTAMAHGKAMKIQVGGMRGVKLALEPNREPPTNIDDVYGTLTAAVAEFGSLEDLPMQPIIQQIAAYKGKVRSRRRR